MVTAFAHSSLRISAEHALPAACSASCYGRAKDVLVEPVVIAKFKLGHVERKILFADLMKRPHHATLEDRPKALDGVGMHSTYHILPLSMVDDLMRVFLMQLPIAHPLIGDQQAHIIRHGFIHKAGQGFGFHIGNDTSNHIALALYRSSHHRLARPCASGASITVVPMSVFGFATDKGFIHFNDPAELGRVSGRHRHTNTMAHIPGGLVGPEPHVAANLQGAHALLARQHQVRDLEPIQQRFIRVLEDRSADMGETIGRDRRTLVALPMPRVAFQLRWIRRTTTWALHAIRPAFADEVLATGFLVRKRFLELWNSQLMQKFLSGHDHVSKFDDWSIAWLN